MMQEPGKLLHNGRSRHKGDELCPEDTRLTYSWQWNRTASGYNRKELENWDSFQTSKCEVGDGWTLEAVQWGHEPVWYSSTICYRGGHISSVGRERETGKNIRVEAQIRAEELFFEWVSLQHKHVVSAGRS